MSWLDLEPEQQFLLWRQLGGAWESLQRDVHPFKRLAEQAESYKVTLAIVQQEEIDRYTPWDFLSLWDEDLVPRDRLAAKIELMQALSRKGLLPAGVTVPWMSYVVYQDFAGGLGVPSASLNKHFEDAKRKLETWLDTSVASIPTPNRAVVNRGDSARPKRARRTQDFRFLE